MKITKGNYAEQAHLFVPLLNDTASEMHTQMEIITDGFEDFSIFENDPKAKVAFGKLLDYINETLQKNEAKETSQKTPEPESKEEKQEKPKRERKPKAEGKPRAERKPKEKKEPKPEKEKKPEPEPAPNQVLKIPASVAYINRYCKLNGKSVPVRRRKGERGASILSLLNSLQKAIKEKVIRKTDEYASEITKIQDDLVKIVNKNEGYKSIVVATKNFDRLIKIVQLYGLEPVIVIFNKFVKIQGKEGVKEEAKKLMQLIGKYIDSGKVGKEVSEINQSLNNYVAGKTNTILISEQTLNGISGLLGYQSKHFVKEKHSRVSTTRTVSSKHTDSKTAKRKGHSSKKAFAGSNSPAVSDAPVITNSHIIPSTKLSDMEFEKAGYQGKWLKLIGDPVEPYHMMIWSKPGKGKSSLAIEFAHYLASQHKKHILYISKDEGNSSYTMQEKFERLNAFHPNIHISDGLIPDNLQHYDYVIFDLMNDFNFSYEDFKFKYLQNPRYKNVSFISIFKSTVDGQYRGDKDWENMFDISVNINDEGYAQAQKNRFGTFGVLKFLEGVTEKVYKFTLLQDAERFIQKRTKEKERMNIVEGNDNKFWVVTHEYAQVLKDQGFSILS